VSTQSEQLNMRGIVKIYVKEMTWKLIQKSERLGL
jgi:hypothetical protein